MRDVMDHENIGPRCPAVIHLGTVGPYHCTRLACHDGPCTWVYVARERGACVVWTHRDNILERTATP